MFDVERGWGCLSLGAGGDGKNSCRPWSNVWSGLAVNQVEGREA